MLKSSSIAMLVAALMVIAVGSARADAFDKAFGAFADGEYGAAAKAFQPLAKAGEVRAQYLLGHMYSTGTGVKEDPAAAIKWYRMAADQGDAVSQLALGTMYANGLGVKRDYVEAYKWFAITEAGDDRKTAGRAVEVRDYIEQLMTADQIDQAKKSAKQWKPS